MRFALSRAAARCQARRLRGTAVNAPLPTAVVLGLVAIAPFVLARVGQALGEELATTVISREIANALVLGPCLAAAAVGAVIAVSSPTRWAPGQQLAAGPFDPRSAVIASLLVPAALAMVVVLPSLLSFSVAIAASFPGGSISGLALVAAILSAVPAGAVAVEGARIVVLGPRRRLLAVGVGVRAWLLMGAMGGAIPLGPLAPAAHAMRGTGQHGRRSWSR